MKHVERWELMREISDKGESWGIRGLTSKLVIIPPTQELDGEDVDTIMRTHNARLERPDKIWVTSILSHKTLTPVYQFAFGEHTWEFALSDMRAFMDNLYQVLEAGITDAFIMHFVSERMAVDVSEDEKRQLGAAMMKEFREFREILNNPPEDKTGKPS